MGEPNRSLASRERGMQPQLPVVLPLLERRRETPRTTTLFFPLPAPPEPCFDPAGSEPGQFFMVWLPGVDEKPFVASYLDEERFGVTVLVRGPFTRRLAELAPGAAVGFRGPYGRGFQGWRGRAGDPGVVLVGGGCGMASLALLAERLARASIMQGAPTAAELLYTDRFPAQRIFTEDGSAGRRGVPTQGLREALAGGGVRAVYTCGPEAMMAAVVQMCREARVPCQASLERYMKCGFGICGQCECDGRLVCQDGPVFSGEELAAMPSFGRWRRSAAGQRTPITAQDPQRAPGRTEGQR